MRQQLSEQISDCYRRAQEARERAERAHDPVLRREFLDMERRWLFMAHSYEFSEGLQNVAGPSRPSQHR